MIPICIVFVLSFVFCSLSYLIIERRQKTEEIIENDAVDLDVTASKESNIIIKTLKFFSNFSNKQWMILIVSLVLQCLLAYRATSILTNHIDLTKILSLSVVLLAASIVDLHVKKIPNIYPILVLSIRGVLIILEFIVQPTNAMKSTILSVAGLVISFVILLLLKFIAKGGFGMGDVKILSASCALAGILTTLYTFTIAMFVCMVVSIFLMATKKRGSKDEIPFGPFIYTGYFITVMLGTLG